MSNLNTKTGTYEVPAAKSPANRYYLPRIESGEPVHHKFYSLLYNEEYEIADWVAYELSRDMLALENVERTDWFSEDPHIPTKSAKYSDYTNSGYTRGHLAPAGDMAHSVDAMEESFFMSNICPQLKAFNQGIWRELEEQVRDWAWKNERIYIVTGPVLESVQKAMLKGNIGVPGLFFKVVLDINEPELKAIGFVIPNQVSAIHLREYALTVDEVEKATGINFFEGLLDAELEHQIESRIDLDLWSFDEHRFQRRIEVWNSN